MDRGDVRYSLTTTVLIFYSAILTVITDDQKGKVAFLLEGPAIRGKA